MRRVYLDHNATTPMSDQVRGAFVEACGQLMGNPSSVHREGQRARAAVEEARRQVALLIGADTTEITFTSGATEANNIALETLARTGGAIVTTCVEHPSVLAPTQHMEDSGTRVLRLGVDEDGRLPPVSQIIREANELGASALSVMLANNETGNIYPVAALAREARSSGLLVHCDATQAVGKIPVSIVELGVDMLSLSAHKFYGPKGVGALFARADLEVEAFVKGGHQERGRRGGTENVPAIVAMGRAAQLAAELVTTDEPRIRALRDRLWEGIARVESSAVRQTPLSDCLPNTLNVRFGELDGETLLINMDLEGIAASAGSACTAGSLEPSHVILAMGVPYEQARASVRFSLGRDTTDEDIDHVLRALPGILSRTRSDGW